jgi:hypothetical protein
MPIKSNETKKVTTTVHRDFEGDAFEASFTITDDVKPSVITIKQKIEGRNFSADRSFINLTLSNIDELIELLKALRPQLGPAPEPSDPNVIKLKIKK